MSIIQTLRTIYANNTFKKLFACGILKANVYFADGTVKTVRSFYIGDINAMSTLRVESAIANKSAKKAGKAVDSVVLVNR